MIIIGITGSFGTGKSAVADEFKGFGAIVLDADKIAHQALTPGAGPYKKVLRIFGKNILGQGGKINRRLLGKIVFPDKPLLQRLCAVIHPYVIKKIKEDIREIKRRRRDSVVVLDIPLLIEADLLNLVDRLIVVKAKRDIQIERAVKKTGLSKKEVSDRIRAQMPIREKIRYADFIIDNSGTKEQTRRKVKTIWEKIQRQKPPKRRI